MLSHLIAITLSVATIVVPVCLFRFVYRFVKKPATQRLPFLVELLPN